MTVNTLCKSYGRLTPEERFRLILAAGARGDTAEQDRLRRSGGRITLAMSDHAPYAHAFHELAMLTFIELLEEAAHYLDAWGHHDDISEVDGEDAEGEPEKESARARPVWQRRFDQALAAGYVLKTKAEGWKLFCEGLSVSPFSLWEFLPGYDRLQHALALADQAAFTAEGFLRWLNRLRPAGEPAMHTVPLGPEGVAAVNEDAFRQRIQWWGG